MKEIKMIIKEILPNLKEAIDQRSGEDIVVLANGEYSLSFAKKMVKNLEGVLTEEKPIGLKEISKDIPFTLVATDNNWGKLKYYLEREI